MYVLRSPFVFLILSMTNNNKKTKKVITDGVSGVTDLPLYDSYAMLLNREHIACSVLLLRSSPDPLRCQLGYIPDAGTSR